MQDKRKTGYAIELRIRRWQRQLQQGKRLALNLSRGENVKAGKLNCFEFHGCGNDKTNKQSNDVHVEASLKVILIASIHLPDIALNMMKRINSLHDVYTCVKVSQNFHKGKH